jgi:RecB family exonuclease
MHRDLEPALLDRIEAARRSDRARPLTILVGSNLLAAHLGRSLARRLGGVFNVRFMTFADLARALAETVPEGPRALLPPFAAGVIVDEILAGPRVPAVFGETAGMKGFGGALSATFADLSEGGCTGELARRLLGESGAAGRFDEKARGTLALFGRYRERVEALGGDLHSIFEDALRGGVPEALRSTIYVYGFYDLNEMQRRVLERVASRADLEIFLPWSGGEAHRFAGRLRERLEREGFDVRDAGAGGGGPGRVGADAPVLLSLPGEEEEIREIARRILTLVRDGRLLFDDVAVVLPAPQAYADLVGEIFDEAGIPYALGSRPLTVTSPAAKAVRALLALLDRGLERRELVEFLVSAPLRAFDAEDAAADHLALWVRDSAEAGIVGERGWIEENAALASRIATAVEKGKMHERSLAAVRHAHTVLRRIDEALPSMRGAAGWTERSERFAALVRGLFAPSEDVERVCGIVESLGRLDALGSAATPGRFFRVAAAAIEEARAAHGRFGGGGVSVLSLHEARGLSFEAVFMPGLAERLFPGPARQDPFLHDDARAALGAWSSGAIALSRKSERAAEDALLFAMALESARGDCVLSVPRFEQGTGKERMPSFVLRYAGFGAANGAGAPQAGAIRLGRGGPERRGLEIMSLAEFDFESARASRGGAGAPPANRFFLRGARLVRGRWGSREFTPYDGVMSSARAREELRRGMEERGYRFSPTALERWAGCPFAYFVGDLLDVEALEEPERIVSATPAQRGILVHRILAGVFDELASAGFLPAREAPPDRLFAIADRVAETMLAEFPRTEPVGLPVFWEMEKRIVIESIRFFLEEERLDPDDFMPVHFERPFGRGGDRAAVAHDRGDRLVHFHGRIDRIDVAPDGRFRVIDYKTGRLGGRDQDLGGGTALQLPVYLLAASRLLDRPVEAGEALYRRVGAGGKRSVRFSGNRWNESGETFARIIETTTRGIEEGLFFAPAGDETCRYCDFKIACTAGAARLFERKARHDPRALAYLEMRGAAGEES